MNSINLQKHLVIDQFNEQVLLLIDRPLVSVNNILGETFKTSHPNFLTTHRVKKLEELLPPLPISVLLNTSTQILYELPAGKPNLDEPLSLDGEDKRSNILQAAQKGPTCWYYAFARLRHRIGDKSPEELKIYRAIEKTISELRKMVTKNLYIPLETYNTCAKKIGCSFSDYLKPITTYFQKTAGELINENHDVAMKFIQIHYAISMGLRFSQWVPQHGLDGLIKALKEKGPMISVGCFGTPYYKGNPVKAGETFGGKNVYTFEEARIDRPNSHAIIIIGADSQGVVFYIDPNDKSDPNDKESQKIYAMSYENHYIPEVLNILTLSDNDPLANAYPWGYHGHFNLPNTQSRSLAQSA